MKKILLLLAALFLSLSVASCASKETTNPISGVYIGTNVKELPTMGHFIGGHMLVLDNDGKIDIHSGGSSVMGGTANKSFTGTYSQEGAKLNLKYMSSTPVEGEEYVTYEARYVENDYIRALLKTQGGIPNDETEPDFPGLNYYKIPYYEIPENILEVYIATKVIDNTVYANLLGLTLDKKFTYIYRAGDKTNTINGVYESQKGKYVLKALDKSYDFDYNKPRIGFSFDSELPSMEALVVKALEM